MSEGSFWPTTWKEAVPLIVWGVLIFSFGLEFVVNLVEGHYGRALFSLAGLAVLTAMLAGFAEGRMNNALHGGDAWSRPCEHDRGRCCWIGRSRIARWAKVVQQAGIAGSE